MAPSTVEILARLVEERTVPRSSNLSLLHYVEELLQGSGARIERFAHPDGNRASLWITVGPDGPGGVVLSGHTDVVPVDGQAWSSDPFRLTERDGRYHGRGCADMKGFVAAALRAARLAARRPLKVPLHLALSYDEEIGCQGVHPMVDALAARSARPALCIVGEPTGMAVATGHKGKIALRARCRGRGGHSAMAPDALNALHLASAFVETLRRRQDALASDGARDPGYAIPYSTVHAGTMRGGTALNVVPDLCEIEFEIRNVAQDDPRSILADIELEAERVVAPFRYRFPEAGIAIETTNAYPGLACGEDDTAVRFLRSVSAERTRPTLKVAFGTEAGIFVEKLGLPTAVCGPGSMEQGHKADEFVTGEQLGLCDAMLERVVGTLERGVVSNAGERGRSLSISARNGSKGRAPT